jgi:hypothetical protein
MRMPVATTPVPERMQHLPRDRRGYPIFFGAFIDEDGTPFFTINDELKRAAMIRDDLCSICGRKLLRGRWFIGGAGSAFHPHGAYIDMPMHDECAHYALVVCPYLAVPSWRDAVAQAHLKQIKDAIVAVDPTMIAGRPQLFVVVMAIGQRMVPGNTPLQRYVRPARPYRKVEYWRHGQRIDDAVGHAEAMQAVAALDAEPVLPPQQLLRSGGRR